GRSPSTSAAPALLAPRRARRDRPPARPRLPRDRQLLREARDPQPADPLGELLHRRHYELQLAAPARPRAGARLCGLARGLPPPNDGPLAPLLGVGRALLPRPPRARQVAAAPRPEL